MADGSGALPHGEQEIMASLFEKAARSFLRVGKMPTGSYSASDLEGLMEYLPEPEAIIANMGMKVGQCPIIFEEVGFDKWGTLLVECLNDEYPRYMPALMPVGMMHEWADTAEAKSLLAYLATHGLSAAVWYGKQATLWECRRVSCVPAVLRPVFLRGYVFVG